MSNGLGVIVEMLVAILLALTIIYCISLNRRLKLLKADEQSLRATISELVTATEIAERAIAGLKLTVQECEAGLGERLRSADRFTAELDRSVAAGEQLLDRLTRIVAGSNADEHARERVSQEMATSLGVGIAGAVLGLGQLGQDLASQVANVTFTLPHSRGQETEADRIGVELAARAGYDPHAAINLWQKMSQVGSGGGPQFLSTHPSPETRLADLKLYADRVTPLYQQARR